MLHGRSITPGANRPVDGSWWSAATTRTYIALSIGMDPLHWHRGDWPTLDRYLDRRHRYYLGLVTQR